MPSRPAPSEALRRGRRALEGLPGLTLLGDLQPEAEGAAWLLPCRLRVAVPPASPIAAVSDWYLRVAAEYPFGAVGFYPAMEGGITGTFPHQVPNLPPQGQQRYRQGLLCLSRNTAALRLRAEEAEPFEAGLRLFWHGQRALRWLETAAAGQLNQPGDPFDLPVLPDGYGPTLIYAAGADSLRWLPPRGIRHGTVEVFAVQGQPQREFLRALYHPDGRTLYRQAWGDTVRDAPQEAVRVLTELGYSVTGPQVPERLDRLEQL